MEIQTKERINSVRNPLRSSESRAKHHKTSDKRGNNSVKIPISNGINIKEITGEVLRHYNGAVQKIILFGSAARGDGDEYSDLDLIIIRDTDERFVERLGKAPFLSVHADIFVYTPKEFKEMRKNENPFILNALEDAKVIYP